MSTTRRSFIVAGAASGLSLWLPDSVRLADAASRRKVPLARDGAFSSGVMSGDPGPNAVTFWTRLDDQDAPRSRVRLDIARDPDFRRVILRRDVPITALRDHTAKLRVGGLKPDERYFFRFTTRTTQSDVGRTQTAPAPDSRRPVKVGYFACQDFSSGWFGAYKRLLELDPDIVVCGGDYIYDRIYSDSGYGGIRPDTAGEGPDSVARTIAQYRAKYRQTRTDPDLKELHRLVPLVAQWDDHEVTDNYVASTEKEEMPDDGEATERYDRARVLSGWRAWHEQMPAMRFGKSYRTYRGLRFGRTVELFMLDSRVGRVEQPCGGGSLVRCPDADGPQTYLGKEQLGWLKDGLARTDASWKLIGNQQMVMPFNLAADVNVEVDSWNGYRGERTELLTHIRDRAKDVVFLTGDIHTFFAGEVRLNGTSGPAVASEVVGGSTTSPGTAQTIARTAGGAPPEAIEPFTDNGVRTNNPWITYADTRMHGCALMTLSDAEVRTQIIGMDDLTTLAGSRRSRQIADLRIVRGRPGVQTVSRD